MCVQSQQGMACRKGFASYLQSTNRLKAACLCRWTCTKDSNLFTQKECTGQYTELEHDTHDHRDYFNYSEYVEVETPDKSHHIFASTHQPSSAPPPPAHPPLRPLETSRTRQPSPQQPLPPPKMEVKLNAAHFRDSTPHGKPQGVHHVLNDTLRPAM